ncbi:MAG TPA: winged helix-turn-helix domain-containing protein [Candidatus Blautia excrementipullorum]|nr:winged helix-turn-helix domain-containing protein [Candidatus Blautia excrementipullorum]
MNLRVKSSVYHTAREACRIKHDISEQSFRKLRNGRSENTLKRQMVIEFPEERLPEISCIKRKLQTLEGVKVYMEPQQIRYPGFFLDTLQRKVMVEEKEVLLTAREFDVLAVMARHPGRVYTYAQICHMIYGETDVGEETYSSAYCLISSLRKKLEKEPQYHRYLHTTYGVGYRFEDVLEK